MENVSKMQMLEDETRDQIMALVDKAESVIVNSVDENGYPNAKAMFKLVHGGLKTFWLSTNTSSMRVQQFMKNSKASLYFLGQYRGLMLIGEMEVCRDRSSREKLWSDGCEKYYPLGVDDPDYSVLKFTALIGNYYFNLNKHTFEIE
jgi:general stress protein 26